MQNFPFLLAQIEFQGTLVIGYMKDILDLNYSNYLCSNLPKNMSTTAPITATIKLYILKPVTPT